MKIFQHYSEMLASARLCSAGGHAGKVSAFQQVIDMRVETSMKILQHYSEMLASARIG